MPAVPPRWKQTMGIRGVLAPIPALALVLGVGVAQADDGVPDSVRNAVRNLVGAFEPDLIRSSPVRDVFEVRAGGEIFYVTADGRYLLHGNLYDVERRHNLTEDSRREIRRDSVDGIDENSLIVFAAHGPAKHRLTVFTDIDCPYCAKFHLEVPELNANGVEVRYAAWPRTPPGTESHDRSISVWCSGDRRQAMTDAKAGRSIAPATCENPVQEHYELGRQLGVSGTPTLFTEDGARIGGYVPWRELLLELEQG